MLLPRNGNRDKSKGNYCRYFESLEIRLKIIIKHSHETQESN